MATSQFDTNKLNDHMDRIRAGDERAWDDLIRLSSERFENLARKMLRSYPLVRQHDQTADVVQDAMVRMIRALKKVRPDSTRAYFALAATQIRRQLNDLARRYAVRVPTAHLPEGIEPAISDMAVREMEALARFHQAVDNLPDNEREVFSQKYYNGWSIAEIAKLIKKSERTVRRWYNSARCELASVLRDDPNERLSTVD